VSRDGLRAAYAVNRNGAHELRTVDLEARRTRTVPLVLDREQPSVIEDRWLTFSGDGRRLAFCAGTSSAPARPFVYDIEHERLIRIAAPTPLRPPPPVRPVTPRLIHYTSFDGRSMPAWWYCRAGVQRCAVVVLLHGGPESQFRPSYRAEVAMLLDAGFAVLAPNVRGSTGYGSSYERLDDIDKRLDAVHDVAHGAGWVASRSGIACDGLVAWGASYGGLLALLAMAHYPALWSAGVTFAAITDLVSFLEQTSPWRRAIREAEYGSLPRDRALLERLSPVRLAHLMRAPLMLAHGANDPRAPVQQAVLFAERLEALGHPFVLNLYPDEGHGFAHGENRERFLTDALEFIDAALTPGAEGEHVGR
jgi:dipeptidyl aminopeptidase/acylaminoacyl peptidase